MPSVSEVPEITAAVPRPTNLAIAGSLCVLAAFVWTYHPVAATLIGAWSGATQTYSYGFLVPIISATLIWIRREELRRVHVKHDFGWGSLVTMFGMFMLFAGRISTLSVLEEMSLIVTISGLTLLLLGRHVFRAVAFPIFYLAAMIPMWDVLTTRVHPYFQDLSARIGMAILQAFDIPAIRQGFLIELPKVTLEVAQECSGVNNLIAVLCVGIAMAHLFLTSWWKRAVVLSAAVAIAVISNGVRVGMVSMFAHYGIRGAGGDIHGPYSLLRSLMVSAVGFVTLFWLISKFQDDPRPFPATTSQRAPEDGNPGPRRRQIAAAAVAVGLLSLPHAMAALHGVGKTEVPTHLTAFPSQLGRWQSTASSFQDDVAGLDFDARLSRTYAAEDGSEIDLFIGYYAHQGPGRELADYRMRAMLLGGPLAASTAVIGDSITKEFMERRRTIPYHVTYWYVLHGRIVSQDYKAKWYTAWNSLAHGTSEGAVVVVRTKMTGQESSEMVRKRVRDFIEATLPASRLYLSAS